MICFVIYGVNIYVSKHKFNSFEEKMYDILMIFVDFCWNFPWFWLIFCYPDPDPADQNETDPNGHWLELTESNMAQEIYSIIFLFALEDFNKLYLFYI